MPSSTDQGLVRAQVFLLQNFAEECVSSFFFAFVVVLTFPQRNPRVFKNSRFFQFWESLTLFHFTLHSLSMSLLEDMI